MTSLATLINVPAPAGAVLCVPMPSPTIALQAQAECLEHQIRVGCFRPLSVPDGVSRLRITTNAGVSEDDWQRTVDVLAKIAETYR